MRTPAENSALVRKAVSFLPEESRYLAWEALDELEAARASMKASLEKIEALTVIESHTGPAQYLLLLAGIAQEARDALAAADGREESA